MSYDEEATVMRARLIGAELIEAVGDGNEEMIALGALDPYVCIATMVLLATLVAHEIGSEPKTVPWVVAVLRGDTPPPWPLRKRKLVIPLWMWVLQCLVAGFAIALALARVL